MCSTEYCGKIGAPDCELRTVNCLSGVHFFFAGRGSSRRAVRHLMRQSSLALILALTFTLPAVSSAQSDQSAPAAQTAQPRRPLTFEDLMQMQTLGATAVSPDGKWLAYSVTTVDLSQNTKTAELWVQAITGGSDQRSAAVQL